MGRSEVALSDLGRWPLSMGPLYIHHCFLWSWIVQEYKDPLARARSLKRQFVVEELQNVALHL